MLRLVLPRSLKGNLEGLPDTNRPKQSRGARFPAGNRTGLGPRGPSPAPHWARSSCEGTVPLRPAVTASARGFVPRARQWRHVPSRHSAWRFGAGAPGTTRGSACGGRGATSGPALTSRHGRWRYRALKAWSQAGPTMSVEPLTHSSLTHCPSLLPDPKAQRNDNKGRQVRGHPASRLLPAGHVSSPADPRIHAHTSLRQKHTQSRARGPPGPVRL